MRAKPEACRNGINGPESLETAVDSIPASSPSIGRKGIESEDDGDGQATALEQDANGVGSSGYQAHIARIRRAAAKKSP